MNEIKFSIQHCEALVVVTAAAVAVAAAAAAAVTLVCVLVWVTFGPERLIRRSLISTFIENSRFVFRVRQHILTD